MTTLPFKPAWWFRNPHLQTIWPALFRTTPRPSYQRERIELVDGDFIDIDWCGYDQLNAPVVILLHGLEGSSDSQYIRGFSNLIASQGWSTAAVNFRGCSGVPNRLAKSYHSGATSDLNEIIEAVSARRPQTALHAVGFSLGGNLLLKWCTEKGKTCSLKSAIAVSVPYDLSLASKTLDRNKGFNSLYRNRLLKSLKQKVLYKASQGLINQNASDIQCIRSLREFDQKLTAPLHGFDGADDYYDKSSCLSHLHKITIPTLLIHAFDDPFMDSSGIPQAAELSESTQLELSSHGGHVGFYQPALKKHCYWLETRISDFLNVAV